VRLNSIKYYNVPRGKAKRGVCNATTARAVGLTLLYNLIQAALQLASFASLDLDLYKLGNAQTLGFGKVLHHAHQLHGVADVLPANGLGLHVTPPLVFDL
jgi:hypothetical protein